MTAFVRTASFTATFQADPTTTLNHIAGYMQLPPASFQAATQGQRDTLPRINAMTLFNTDSGQVESWTNDSWLKHVMYNQTPTYGDTLSYNSVLARFEPTPVNNPVVKSLEVYGQELSNGNYSLIVQPAYGAITTTKTGTGTLTLAGPHTLTGSVNSSYNIRIDSSGTSSWDTATFKWSSDGGVTWNAQGIPCALGSVSGHKVLSPITLNNGVQILFSTGTYVLNDLFSFNAIAATNQRLKLAANTNGVLTYESFIATDTAGVNSINITSSGGTANIYFNDALSNYLTVSGKVATLVLNSTVGLTVDTTSTAAGGVSPYASLLMSNITTPTAVGAGVGGKFYAKGDNPTWQTGTGVETNLLAGPWTLLTTKGDLFTFDTANARLGVGTNNALLQADSSTATGLKWTLTPNAVTTFSATGQIAGSPLVSSSQVVAASYIRAGATAAPTNTTAGDTNTVRLYVGANGTAITAATTLNTDTVNGGYLRVGSLSAPTNTTAGDLTAIRVLAGDATLASGVVLAAAGNATTTGYTRVGSATAPTNTTAGDLTAVRLLAGNAALASGVTLAATGNATVTGYARLGSASAPSNTTAGDMNAVRALVGTDASMVASTALNVNGNAVVAGYLYASPGGLGAPSHTSAGDMQANNAYFSTVTLQAAAATLTSQQTLVGISTATTLNFASATLFNFSANNTVSYQQSGSGFGAYFGVALYPTLQNLVGNTANLANVNMLYVAPTYQADTQTITSTNAYGFFYSPTYTRVNAGTLTSTADVGVSLNATVSTGATLTTRYGILYADATVTGTLTNQYAIDIAALTAASTVNVGIRNASRYVAKPPAAQAIALATDTIAPTSQFFMISNTTGGSITLTSAPTIADGQDGQMVWIMNVGTANVVVQDQGALASSNLRLTTASVTISPRRTLILIYSASIGDWVQMNTIGPVI